jgi:hypothetical protein
MTELKITSVECIDQNELRFHGEKTYVLDRGCNLSTSTGNGISMNELNEVVTYGRDELKEDDLDLLNYIASNYGL